MDVVNPPTNDALEVTMSLSFSLWNITENHQHTEIGSDSRRGVRPLSIVPPPFPRYGIQVNTKQQSKCDNLERGKYWTFGVLTREKRFVVERRHRSNMIMDLVRRLNMAKGPSSSSQAHPTRSES